MQEIAKAIIVITCDDVNDYFLVIDLATGKEVKRVSTEQLRDALPQFNVNGEWFVTECKLKEL